ncbi:MAG TPA: hypothetical protein VN605_13735 [Thermoanaerobaculia bacterium]|nr:hypothetical protein [Thermoanaerobaculia bacterium]
MTRTRVFTLLAAILLLSAITASAQSVFSIGPRISNYSTRIEGDPTTTLRTGRQTAFGLVGDYRNGNFDLDFAYDRDSSNGASITDIFVDTGDYQRNRGELAIGYSILPVLDLQGGARIEQIRFGGFSLFGNAIGSDLTMDHQALVAGIRLHSTTMNPAGFYLIARGLVGTAKFDDNANTQKDTSGWRAEVGIPIVLGASNWHLVPGAEYEKFDTKTFGLGQKLRLDSNRVFLNFVFSMR